MDSRHRGLSPAKVLRRRAEEQARAEEVVEATLDDDDVAPPASERAEKRSSQIGQVSSVRPPAPAACSVDSKLCRPILASLRGRIRQP